MREPLDEQLARVETALEDQGDAVMLALRESLAALVGDDVALAERVIAGDDAINRRCTEIETEIQVLLARQTPVAVDLRRVLGALHVNLSLERIADYAATISKLERLAAEHESDDDLLAMIETMGLRTEQMIRVALDSFTDRDLEKARSVEGLDDLVDEANRAVVGEVLRLAEDPAVRGWALQMLVVARSLERIGDHAVDIAEQTIFLVTGEVRSRI